MAVRTLDLAKFHGSDVEQQEFARDLLEGFSETGFVKLVNHGFSQEDFTKLFAWNKAFFSLSHEEKEVIANATGPKPQRGWSGLGVEKTGTLNKPGTINLTRVDDHNGLQDLKEHFDMGPVGDVEFSNLWPREDALPGFRSWMEHYFATSQRLSLQLMRALEVAMALPAGALTDRCAGHASELRLNHYPATPAAALRDGGVAKRIWPHTDFGIITLLAQDGEGGLEIEAKTKPAAAPAGGGGSPSSFVPVPLEDPTELVVNVGDTLERWTNGRLGAGLHQVTLPRGVEADDLGDVVLPTRYSVAFFLKANRAASVGPIRLLVPEGGTAAYEDMTALEYQQRRTAIVY